MPNYITVKAPKEIFNVKEYRAQLLRALDISADEVVEHFKSSIATFSHKPQVHKRVTQTKKANKARIWISDENYARLNNGTDTHDVGVGGKLMRFPGYNMPPNVTVKGGLGANKYLYKSKTAPGRIKAEIGFPRPGTQLIVRRGPWPVKGIEPRKFDEQIAAAVGPDFIRRTNEAVEKAMK